MKRERIGSKIKYVLAIVALLGMWLMPGTVSRADQGTVTFGSNSYAWDEKETVPFGVYIQGDEVIDSYEVVLRYDPSILRYIDGANEQNGSLLYLKGAGGNTNNYRYMLHFETIKPGSTRVEIAAVAMYTVEKPTSVSGNEVLSSAKTQFNVTGITNAPVLVRKVGSSKLSELSVEPVNISGFSTDVLEYEIDVPGDTEKIQVSYIAEDDGAQINVSDTNLKVGANEVTIQVNGADEVTTYVIRVNRAEPSAEPVASEDPAKESSAVEEKPSESSSASSETSSPASEDEEDEEEEEEGEELFEAVPKALDKIEPFVLSVGVIATGVLLIAFFISFLRERKNENRTRRSRSEDLEVINLEGTVIKVCNVTMNFKMAQDEASSLKEYLIRAVKGQNQYSYFSALKDVSFEVKQGDVVGIIGTNGSGKSTILKIVSGAFKPTSGHVEVDRSKVQILTLGTGFDMELTARENVYLNGSIIGYTREYIDEKYDDIVKFAELEGFMEERMKNFSSGMVSRLGFAIATMREAPDILILDEVLSVGDMFFRKKSLKRIRKMIHGGATVLIVSHSMDTILKNCNKVVWIEKGELKMVGDPQTVCAEYEKYGAR